MSAKKSTSAADEIASECIAVRVRMLNRTITAIYDEAFRPLGMTVGQMNILVLIAKRGPISPIAVARRLNMEKSTVSRNIERMRSQGWVVVSRDGRGQELSASATGRRQLDKALPLWRVAQAEAEQLLGQRGSEAMHRVADRVWAGLATE